MYFDFHVKIPENTGRISLNKRKGTTYVEYTYGRKYIPEKRYNVPQRTTIGKMDPDDPSQMFPIQTSSNIFRRWNFLKKKTGPIAVAACV